MEMPIPEAQLEIWARQGAITGSASTYDTIKRALESEKSKYADRRFTVFLQGSYGNDTNIRAESDVDVVVCHHCAYFYDIDQLTAEEQAAFKGSLTGAGPYSYESFKVDVQRALKTHFGDSVEVGDKAIKVFADGSRRNADVIVAFDHRRYHQFASHSNCSYFEGISIFPAAGERIDNFPKHHSDNATAKHQATNGNYKPLVRIFKNLRGKLIDDGRIKRGDAPSYFIEGLLYNVPTDRFVGSYGAMVFKILKWLRDVSDQSNFVCVNERYYLLRDDNPVCWPRAKGAEFIDAAIGLWDEWL